MNAGEAPNELVNAPPSQDKGQPAKLSFVLISGERFRMSASEFWALMTDGHSIAFFALAGALIAYLYPERYVVGLSWGQVAVAIAVMETVLILTIIAQFLILSRVVRRNARIVFPATLVVLIAVIVMETVKRAYAHFFWGPDWISPTTLFQATVAEYVFCFLLEVIFSLFVVSHTKIYPLTVINQRGVHRHPAPPPEPLPLPQALAPAVVTPKAPPVEGPVAVVPARAPAIKLAGETIELGKLRMIRAEEHYIRVTTTEGSVLLRHRMMDAVALIPAHYGLQVHRSLWLAFAEVERFSQLPDGKLLVVLTDKSEVFVPRARRKEVEAQLAESCV